MSERPLSIKRRIMDHLVERISELKNDLDVLDPALKLVERAVNPLQESKALPSVFIYDGTEQEVERDTKGRTYNFPVILVLRLKATKLPAETLDTYVAAIQEKMEANIQLDALGVVMDDASVEPFINDLDGPVIGAAISYRVQYRRKLGLPWETY